MKKNVLKYSIAAGLAVLLCASVITVYNGNNFSIKSDTNSVRTVNLNDYEYKKSIVESSKNPTYTVENLAPLAGRNELAEFIKKNDDNSEIYTASKGNIEKGTYRANLHMHTLNSDGSMSVKELMDKAQEYAKDFPEGEYMYVAITDHNTVLGAQDVIKTLEENPGKYDKIKVVAGIEINTSYNNSQYKPSNIHVLLWAINPYDEFLCKEFYKADLSDKGNRKTVDPDFDKTISTMKNYGLVGVAHPARYISHLEKDSYYNYLDEMFKRYKKAAGKRAVFTEGYYQTYTDSVKAEFDGDFENVSEYIHKKAKSLGITQTGSHDTHGKSIFKK